MLSSLIENHFLHAIIVASGMGKRMKSTIPKQFLLLEEKPIILHTINQFLQCNFKINIVVVLPEKCVAYFKTLCEKYQFDTSKLHLTTGGSTRFHSVKNGLKALSVDKGQKTLDNWKKHIVAIHDAARPLVSEKTIKNAFILASQQGAAVASTPVNSSMRQYDYQNNHWPVDRNKYRIIQTPQAFDYDILLSAYQTLDNKAFTDDATVVEAFGHKTFLFDDSPLNIKITTTDDLILASALLKIKKNIDAHEEQQP